MKRLMLTIGFAAIPACAQAACDPSGTYRRNAALDQSVLVRRIEGGFEVMVSSSGVRFFDGVRTVGAARGKLDLSDKQCIGAYLAPEDECALFFVFRAKALAVHQFGSCMFGAGAWAGGSYKRTSPKAAEKMWPQHDEL